MTIREKLLLLGALILTHGAQAQESEVNTIVMGDGQIDGTKIAPFESRWRQCSKQGNEWVAGGNVIERANEVKKGDRPVLRHEQEVHAPNGMRTRAVTTYDRATLSPLATEMRARDGQDRVVGAASYTFEEDGYSGLRGPADNQQPIIGEASSLMYRGFNLGLALATLDPETQLPATLKASMVAMDATYDVIVTFAGRETLTFDGQTVDAWMADVEWHHLGLGDVYPPGPDASGGRYWIVADPPEGVPYVPRYQTDTYAVEFARRTCP